MIADVQMTAVAQAMRRFIKEENESIVCVRGDWGVGKTYTWNALLENTPIANRGEWSNYTYISLFGITSISEIKELIVDDIVREQLGSGPINSHFKPMRL